MRVLVFVEQRHGRLRASSLEALSAGSLLCGDRSDQLAAVLVGKAVEQLVSELKGRGPGIAFVASDDCLEHYNALSYSRAVERAIHAFSPDAVLGLASPMGRDLFPRLSARLDAGLLTDLIELDQNHGFSGGVKPMYAGKVMATVSYQGEGLKLATLRPNVFPLRSLKSVPSLAKIEVAGLSDERLKAMGVKKGHGNKADLTEAARIISGGRAMGSSDNFELLHKCAQVLQASVGASRAAVDSGYASHDMQVGQTGKTVNPNLYIACGISGMVQHMAGMKTSKVIVAVNKDPDAPIFGVADYGIVGDLFEVIPAMTRKLQGMLDS